ncbi:MAG: hypothetical protein JSU73_05775 [candidate division WOR-3 bacterium]|nr:MAG: hypothetical protein JSU73_05775 [candidate division WOR-3 bacterium]
MRGALASMAVLLTFVAAAYGQNDQLPPIHGSLWGIGDFMPANLGARGQAMGGCNVATAKGYQALLKNPAGVASVTENQVGLDGHVVVLALDYEDDEDVGGGVPKLGGLGVVVPVDLTPDVRAGFALGWGAFYDNTFAYWTWTGRDEEYRQFGGYHVLLPTASVCYDDRWSAGVSLGLPVCSPYGARWVRESSGEPYESELTGTVEGTFSQLGVLGHPWPWLSVGASVTPGLDLKIDEPVYSSEDWEEEFEDVNIEIPSQHSIGVAVHPVPKLTFAGEYSFLPLKRIEWEGYRWPGHEYSEYSGIENGATWRVGVEYRTLVDLRVGAYRSNYWQRAEYDERDPAELTLVTAGVGFDVGSVSVDISAEYGSYEEPGSEYHQDPELTNHVGRLAAQVGYSWPGWASAR